MRKSIPVRDLQIGKSCCKPLTVMLLLNSRPADISDSARVWYTILTHLQSIIGMY